MFSNLNDDESRLPKAQTVISVFKERSKEYDTIIKQMWFQWFSTLIIRKVVIFWNEESHQNYRSAWFINEKCSIQSIITLYEYERDSINKSKNNDLFYLPIYNIIFRLNLYLSLLLSIIYFKLDFLTFFSSKKWMPHKIC